LDFGSLETNYTPEENCSEFSDEAEDVKPTGGNDSDGLSDSEYENSGNEDKFVEKSDEND